MLFSQFNKISKIFKLIAVSWLVLLIFISFTGEFLANDRPILCIQDQEWIFPVLMPKHMSTPCLEGFTIWPPVKHHIGVMDTNAKHVLGTDYIGRDVLALVIYGTRYSLIIGFLSSALAFGIGLILGSISGYFYQHNLSLSRGVIIGMLMGFFLGYYYAFFIHRFDGNSSGQISMLTQFGLLSVIWGIGTFLGYMIGRIKGLNKHIKISPDAFILRSIEFLEALPSFLVIIAIVAWHNESFVNKGNNSGGALMVIILTLGALLWTSIARLMRGEVIKSKQLPYVEAAYGLGYKAFRIMFRHILPNVLPAVWILAILNVGRAIVAEATLSFLGMGSSMFPSWGKMLHLPSWEVIYVSSISALLLPGLMIGLTTLSLYTLGNKVFAHEKIF